MGGKLVWQYHYQTKIDIKAKSITEKRVDFSFQNDRIIGTRFTLSPETTKKLDREPETVVFHTLDNRQHRQ